MHNASFFLAMDFAASHYAASVCARKQAYAIMQVMQFEPGFDRLADCAVRNAIYIKRTLKVNRLNKRPDAFERMWGEISVD